MAVEALLFPGQGLRPQEIIGYYKKLDSIDRQHTGRWMGLVQDDLDKIIPDETYSVLESLNSEEDSPFRKAFGKTAFIQPVVYGLSIAAYELAQHKLNVGYVAGHSLGEYAALVAAGVIDPKIMLGIVTYRGRFMQETAEGDPSRLISLIGADLETAKTLCFEVARDRENIAYVALENAPNLTVVGCPAKSIERVESVAKTLPGVRRAVTLNADGYHTPLMAPAAKNLAIILEQNRDQFKKIKIPIVANVSGEIVALGIYPISNLIDSITKPVRWRQMMGNLKGRDVGLYIGAGPTDTLGGLVKSNGISEGQFISISDLMSQVPVQI